MNKLINGDCLAVMKSMPTNSVDSIVSDPPYGLHFMGKKWDYDIPKVEVWQEAMRVLKPGGHALIACGTRTQHRMAVNLEDAGFEIRDIVAWVYGSGFPKSLNIGKAVDKLQGNEREVIGESKRHGGGKNFSSFGESLENNPKPDITKGTSPHEGWGTNLKPAMELWTLCRKPLEKKTVASNVLKYGTGGINIDGCRVESSGKDLEKLNSEWDRDWNTDYSTYAESVGGNAGFNMDKAKVKDKGITGRFPANLIHDGSEEVVSKFPDSKGASSQNNKSNGHIYRGQSLQESETSLEGYRDWYNDSGSASRFFYCAKASKAERNKGLEGFEEKEVSHGLHSTSFIGDKEYKTNTIQKNNHPTVKPIALMKYLCRLITPKGGTILDCFMGSGSTGVGAKAEGFDFIGIELDPEYCKIAQARIGDIEIEQLGTVSETVKSEKPIEASKEIDNKGNRCPACGGKLKKTKYGKTCEDCLTDY